MSPFVTGLLLQSVIVPDIVAIKLEEIVITPSEIFALVVVKVCEYIGAPQPNVGET
jgi:hypothetical protein